jgi:hypothetical protein
MALFGAILRVSMVKTILGHFREVESDANATSNHVKQFMCFTKHSVGGRDRQTGNSGIWLLA